MCGPKAIGPAATDSQRCTAAAPTGFDLEVAPGDARVVVSMRPQVMLFDEVTSALDPVLVNEVLAVVRDLRADGMTMVIATHEMGFARRVADQVGFLHHGVLKELGSAEQVLEHPQTPELQSFLKAVREAGRL